MMTTSINAYLLGSNPDCLAFFLILPSLTYHIIFGVWGNGEGGGVELKIDILIWTYGPCSKIRVITLYNMFQNVKKLPCYVFDYFFISDNKMNPKKRKAFKYNIRRRKFVSFLNSMWKGFVILRLKTTVLNCEIFLKIKDCRMYVCLSMHFFGAALCFALKAVNHPFLFLIFDF